MDDKSGVRLVSSWMRSKIMEFRLFFTAFLMCAALPGGIVGDSDSCGVIDFDTKIEFPYRLRMVPNHVLIVHGRHLADEVVLDWEPGDSLRIDGIAVFPFPPSPPRAFTEEELEDVYGDVPFVLERVKAGSTWTGAVGDYTDRIERIMSRLVRRYWEVRDSTGSHGEAMEAALESLDRSLLDPGVEPRSTGNGILLKWAGLKGEGIIDLRGRPVDKPKKPKVLTEAEAQHWAKMIIRRLEPVNESSMVVAISRGGASFLDSEGSRKAIRQLEAAKQGMSTEGPLSEGCLREILEVYGGE